MRGEIIEFFIIKQIKKPRLVLCSVVKHLGSGRALKKWGTATASRAFPYTSFVLYRFLRALQQNTAQSRLLYLLTNGWFAVSRNQK